MTCGELPAEMRAALEGRTATLAPCPDGPEGRVDAAAGGLAAAVLALARSRYELAEAVRSSARGALDDGIDPDEARRQVLARLDFVEPEVLDDLAVTVRAALDDILGPEAGGA